MSTVDVTWPSAEEIAEAHSKLGDVFGLHRGWCRFDFSGCRHEVMISLTPVGVDQPDWHAEICPTCGYVESSCNHNEFEWNKEGTLLRCKTCGIDGT